MSAKRIDGHEISAGVKAAVAKAVAALPGQPCLAVVLVGEDPASQVYVRNKGKATVEAGMLSRHYTLAADATQAEVEAVIANLNADPSVDGILLQLPLPKGLDPDAAIARIDPAKDVDGLTEISTGRLALGKPGLRPCTPTGCVIMAKEALGENLSGKHVVVIGRSILVGKPTAQLFLAENCTVTIAHSRTKDLAAVCRLADILVPAVGQPEMVRGDWVKPGAAIIDVGINRVPAPEKGEGKTKLVGDAHFDSCAEVAAHITPVPGGVGLMTVACLLRNTVIAACARRGWTLPPDL
ncbi:bifunctional 5,10-methylenetetrahydrofolate dehydrogenase/5,10-methenyltetrahydrofolate cyclohydrolase [Hyphomonas sp.]|jgi:methylenetetrahydrofolate dehydrogenase (NADP+)/methenyltetrahydrofolate cyclohydrolase|uniref:bifunctional 5,10-methylenetetrahydrofolate dehydrogenase/5,10-methenyltetrahydrofolate cyclohydrolase n=1 Tax=Hyphomonas sp. TaxID=87 RepID=UPI0025C45952|nr:bifunctional methylenetetrahydrofolate dehydrogenase/methenyltetrahydrofolate cyclohydrolase FolD [Hyphomonas sp.]